MSAEVVAARVAQIPAGLSKTATLAIPATRKTARYFVTGGGLSEGPARVCCAWLRQSLGVMADFVPQSDFFVEDFASPKDTTLVMFSQGLAPNARLPLVHASRFAEAVLFTSMTADKIAVPEVRVVTHSPAQEDGLLLRVIGPTLAIAAAVRWCESLGAPRLDFDEIARCYEQALLQDTSRLVDEHGALSPVALLAGGRYAEFTFPLRWKLLEGLHVSDPPVWDLLQIAHGPFQSFYERPFALLGLVRHDSPRDIVLLDRVEQMLAPTRHRLLRLSSSLPGIGAWFEHDAQLNRLVVDALRTTRIDLARWPGKGHDGPIYDVAPETLRR